MPKPVWKRKWIYQAAVPVAMIVAALIGLWRTGSGGESAKGVVAEQSHDGNISAANNENTSVFANPQVNVQNPQTVILNQGSYAPVDSRANQKRSNGLTASGQSSSIGAESQVTPSSSKVSTAQNEHSSGSTTLASKKEQGSNSAETHGPCSPAVVGSNVGDISANCSQD